MPKLNLFLNHHEAETPMPNLKETKAEFLVFWENCGYIGEYVNSPVGDFFSCHSGIIFDSEDDFLWTELPKEVSVDG